MPSYQNYASAIEFYDITFFRSYTYYLLYFKQIIIFYKGQKKSLSNVFIGFLTILKLSLLYT